MTNKIKKFLYTLEHLIPDGYEIPTFALYHPLLTVGTFNQEKALVIVKSSGTFGYPSFEALSSRYPVMVCNTRCSQVGSQSLLRLMSELGKVRGYTLSVDQRTQEVGSGTRVFVSCVTRVTRV